MPVLSIRQNWQSKGEILTLVRNNIDAIQTTTHMDDSEFQVLNLKKKEFRMKLANLYSPNDKALSLNALPAVEDHYLVVGDFNSHSHSWGYDHIDKKGEEFSMYSWNRRQTLFPRWNFTCYCTSYWKNWKFSSHIVSYSSDRYNLRHVND